MCCRSSLLALLAILNVAAPRAMEVVSFHANEVARFSALIASESTADRLEGIKGLSALKHWRSEEKLLPFCLDDAPEVRLEAAIALGRIGTKHAVPRLISLRDDPSWEVSKQAEAALAAIASAKRDLAIDEDDCLKSLQEPGLSARKIQSLCEALERVGTRNAVPILERLRNDAAAWALGAIGGSGAEAALLKFPKSGVVLLNLDRVGSTNCGILLPHLVHSFGLVTYRAHPDDLDLPTAQPAQRVAANLISRSGRAPLLIEATLRELEATMNPPIRREPGLDVPEDLAGLLNRMREELKPGFVRGDGETTSQPVAALYHVVSDPALAPRLIPLLRHPAFVPRIYVGMLLGKLKSDEAVSEMAAIIREGYSFSDATALASGKHFEQSQTVRWRGFLCMALGKVGSEQACRALEEFACDAKQPRDVRFGAVVGLGFALNPKSESALKKVAREDVIWMVREEAARVLDQLRARKPKLAVSSK